MAFNGAIVGLLVLWMRAKFDGLEKHYDGKFDAVNARFDAVNAKFDAVNRRFDDMRDLGRAELHRVEEILDARLQQDSSAASRGLIEGAR
jgi:hypothetical protein